MIRWGDNPEVEGIFTKNGQDETISVYLDENEDGQQVLNLKSPGDLQSQVVSSDVSETSRLCAQSFKGDEFA